MEKIKIANQAFPGPMPVVIVGAEVNGKPNYLTVAWITRVNFSPPMLGIALGKSHHTNRGIREHGEFSVSVPGAELLKAVDYAGLVSGIKTDKSELFEPFYGELRHAPMVRECPLTMECRVVQTVDLPVNEFFIGEIVGVYTEERFLRDGKPDMEKMNPFVLSMPDNHYWCLGEPIGRAWQSGREFKPRSQ
jgi:flavin reductase (DIM6/NTAB) family NADH-FMN oxidoreductase RutF